MFNQRRCGLFEAKTSIASGHSFIDMRCLQVEALFASGRADEGNRLLDVLLRDHGSDARLLALRDKLNSGR